MGTFTQINCSKCPADGGDCRNRVPSSSPAEEISPCCGYWVSQIPRTAGGHPKPTAASQIPFPTKWAINFLSGFIGIIPCHSCSSWCHHHQSQSSSCLGFCRKCTEHFCIINVFLRARSRMDAALIIWCLFRFPCSCKSHELFISVLKKQFKYQVCKSSTVH